MMHALCKLSCEGAPLVADLGRADRVGPGNFALRTLSVRAHACNRGNPGPTRSSLASDWDEAKPDGAGGDSRVLPWVLRSRVGRPRFASTFRVPFLVPAYRAPGIRVSVVGPARHCAAGNSYARLLLRDGSQTSTVDGLVDAVAPEKLPAATKDPSRDDAWGSSPGSGISHNSRDTHLGRDRQIHKVKDDEFGAALTADDGGGPPLALTHEKARACRPHMLKGKTNDRNA